MRGRSDWWAYPLLRVRRLMVPLLQRGLGTYPFLRVRPLTVPLLQRLTFEKRKSKQNASAPPLGASLRLGMPSLRH